LLHITTGGRRHAEIGIITHAGSLNGVSVCRMFNRQACFTRHAGLALESIPKKSKLTENTTFHKGALQ